MHIKRKLQFNKSQSHHISLVTNVSASQISETETHFNLTGVPVVVDGAEMNGIIYEKEDNEKGLDTLVDKVITLGHPFDDAGNPIDAYSSKAVMDNFGGGVVTNRYKTGSVNMVDISIKKSLLQAQDNGEWYYNQLKDKKPIGVSTGLYHVVKDGKSTEQMYNHLALLPEDEAPAGGDATFIRFNSAKTFAVNVDTMIVALKDSANETGEAIRNALHKKYGQMDKTYFYVEDWNDEEVIFHLETTSETGSFKSNWKMVNGSVELTGDPVPVKRKTVWMQAASNMASKFASMFKISNNADDAANGNKSEGNIMDRNQIIALLTGKGIQVNKDLTDNQLMELLEKSLAGNAKDDKQEPAGNGEAIAQAVTAAVNAAVKPLSDEIASLKAAANNSQKAAKDKLIGELLAVNSVYTKEELEAMPETALNKMAAQYVPAFGVSMQMNSFTKPADDEFKDYDMNAAITGSAK